MSYTSVKGMDDIVPPQSCLWADIEKKARHIFESFGFYEIKTPVVEKTELFTRGIGTATDIVEKQMYIFTDKNGDSLALRPEGTAPVVRAYIEHQLYHPDPYQKLYYMSPMFRYERMQKGRTRQHMQLGAEVFGASSPRIDAEVIFMLTQFYQAIGIENFKVQINSLGCKACRPGYREKLLAHFRHRISELCEDCKKRLEKNPLRILDCKNEQCQKVAVSAPQMTNHLCAECRAHFEGVKTSLNQLNVTFEVNPNIVRVLDYYVRTTFEIVSSDLGAQSALGGGGRYDGLVAALGGPDVSGIGFGSGIERLIIALEKKVPLGSATPQNYVDLFISALGPKAQAFSYGLINKLRLQGVRAEVDYDDHPLKTQMKKADRMNSRFVLIIGEDEMNKGEAILRNMNTKEQKSIPFGDILNEMEKNT
ncbi:MAG: histidine--tRNA ligase [Deltaproteobacteria bacterium]|nr:histidine--tRNA ligase [Deltaproteobacteria bacterium]